MILEGKLSRALGCYRDFGDTQDPCGLLQCRMLTRTPHHGTDKSPKAMTVGEKGIWGDPR